MTLPKEYLNVENQLDFDLYLKHRDKYQETIISYFNFIEEYLPWEVVWTDDHVVGYSLGEEDQNREAEIKEWLLSHIHHAWTIRYNSERNIIDSKTQPKRFTSRCGYTNE